MCYINEKSARLFIRDFEEFLDTYIEKLNYPIKSITISQEKYELLAECLKLVRYFHFYPETTLIYRVAYGSIIIKKAGEPQAP